MIEINTSSLRKGCTETMPGNEMLEIYINNGGKYINTSSKNKTILVFNNLFTLKNLMLIKIFKTT